MAPRKSRWLVPGLLFVGALVWRLWGLGWGLPDAHHWYSYHPDERQLAAAVLSLNFLNLQFNPHFFNYPSLDIYLSHLVWQLAMMLGMVSWPQQVPRWQVLHDVLLCSRLVAATTGALTVPLVWSLARRVAGCKAAWWAAIIMLLLPGHVQHSHFATVDVPGTFLVVLVLWLVGRGRRGVWLACVVAGLAAATKYNLGFVWVVPAALLIAERQVPVVRRTGRGLAAAGLGVAGFLAGCPYALLSPHEFLGDGRQTGFLYELLVHPRQGSGLIFVQTGNGWWFHLTHNLTFAMTPIVLLIALAGLIYCLCGAGILPTDDRDQNSSKLIWCLLGWVVIYFLSLGFSEVRFMRYVLPILPPLVVLAGVALHRLRVRWLRWAVAGLALVRVIGWQDPVLAWGRPDPRDSAAQWMQQQIRPGERVGVVDPPWFWSPPLSPVDQPPGAPPETPPPGSIVVSRLGPDAGARPAWWVISEFEWRDRERLRDPAWQSFTDMLNRHYTLAQQFETPYWLPVWPRPIPHDALYTHPTIRCYHRIS